MFHFNRLRHHKTTLFLSGLIILSLFIKLFIFLFFFHGNAEQITQPDSNSYLAPAQSLLSQHSFYEMFERTPGYPLFIAGLFWLLGHHLTAIIVAQIVLSTALILEAFFIAKRLFSNHVARLSALLIAINTLIFSYNLMILSETLFVVLIGAAFLSGVYLFSGAQKSLLWTFLLGLFLALSTWTRPINYYLILPVMALTLGYFFKNKRNRIFTALFFLLLPTFILVGGWKIRNNFVLHSSSYSSISAYNLYWHYAGDILQKSQHRSAAEIEHLLQLQLQQQPNQDPAELEKYMKKTALHIIQQHPILLTKQMLRGFSKLMLNSDSSWLIFFNLSDKKIELDQAKKELLSFNVQHLFHHYSKKILCILLAAFLVSMSITLYYIFFLIGIIQLNRTSFRYAHLFLLGCLCYFILVSSNAISYGRFRIPFELIIDVYTSFGLFCAAKKILHRKKSATVALEAR